MAEYQYYEFTTIHRTLSRDEQQTVGTWSSRAVVTSNSASFTYNYGDFKHKPETCLLSYFDMMLYVASYGCRRLMFRFPEKTVDFKAMKAYAWDNADDYEHSLLIYKKDGFVVVDIDENLEEGFDNWVEGEGILSGLASLWTDIVNGNYACLYLAWANFATQYLEIMEGLEEDEDEGTIKLFEPPVPVGLKKDYPALREFMDFWDISDDLRKAAAQKSPEATEVPLEKLEQALDRLPLTEKNDYLRRLLHNEPLLRIELLKRLHEIMEIAPAPAADPTRSVKDLLQAKVVVAADRTEREKLEAAEKRRLELESMRKRESAIWDAVWTNLLKKTASGYQNAINDLKDLRDLADYCNTKAAFDLKIAEIREQFQRSPTLLQRLRDAQLG